MISSKYITTLTGLSLENAFYQGKGDKNPDHIPVFMVPAIDSAQEELGYDLRNGAIAYATDLETFIFRKGNGHGGFEWVQLNEGRGGGDVVGPGASTIGGIVTFADEDGKQIADSTLNILDLRNALDELGNLVQKDKQEEQAHQGENATPTYSLLNLSHLHFVEGVGSVLVDDLMPVQFLKNSFGSGASDVQVCSVFTGELPSSSTTPSCLVELQSTTGALVLSRMTTAQRQALKATNGMLVYDTTLNQFWSYQNGAWAEIGGGGVPVPLNLTFAGSGPTFSANNTGSGEAAKLTSGTASALEVTSSSLQATILSMNLSDGPAGRFVNGGKGFSLALSPALDETNGGTAQTGYTKGDMLYASAFNTLSKLSVGTSPDGYVCTLKGGLPAWMPSGGVTFPLKGTSSDNNHKTSGTLAMTNTSGGNAGYFENTGGGNALYATSKSPSSSDFSNSTLYAENTAPNTGIPNVGGSAATFQSNVGYEVTTSTINCFNDGTGQSINARSNASSAIGQTGTIFAINTYNPGSTSSGRALFASSANSLSRAIDTLGVIFANGAALPSSLRLKDIDHSNADIALEASALFKRIPFSKYKMKDGSALSKHQYGLVSESLNEVMPEAVYMDAKTIIPNLLLNLSVLAEGESIRDRRPLYRYRLSADNCSEALIEEASRMTEELINILFTDENNLKRGTCVKILSKTVSPEDMSFEIKIESDIKLPNTVFAYGTYETCPYVNKNMVYDLGMTVIQGLLKRIEQLEQSIPWHKEERKEELH